MGNIRGKKWLVISYLSAFDVADGNLDSTYEVGVIIFIESHIYVQGFGLLLNKVICLSILLKRLLVLIYSSTLSRQ